MLDLSAKQPKKRRDWQAYSHLYWNGKLKQEVHGEWDAHKKTMLEKAATENAKLPTFPDGALLSFHNKVVQWLFATESPEVRDEVEKFQNRSTVADKPDKDVMMDQEEAEHAAKAQQYHK